MDDGVPDTLGVASLFRMLDGVLSGRGAGDGDVIIGECCVERVEGDATKMPLSTCSSASLASSGSVHGTIPTMTEPPATNRHCLCKATCACTCVL